VSWDDSKFLKSRKEVAFLNSQGQAKAIFDSNTRPSSQSTRRSTSVSPSVSHHEVKSRCKMMVGPEAKIFTASRKFAVTFSLREPYYQMLIIGPIFLDDAFNARD
jgi:hypothetical protein